MSAKPAMGSLNLLDLAVLLSYVIGITIIGSRFYRRKTGLTEYFLGGKGMAWFPVALSILAADTSALTYLGTPAWTFRHDMKLNMVIFTYLISIPIAICVFLPIYSRGNLYTAYELLERRFDLRIRLVTSLLFLLVRGSHVAIIIYAPALVMSQLMGVPLKFSVIVTGLLTAFYTMMGGIKAVIWTDAIQVGTVLLGFSVVAVTALNHIPGGMREVVSTGIAHGKFNLFDFSLSLGRVDNFWPMMMGGTLMSIQAISTDQAVLQKYFTTKSKKETTKSLLFYGAILIPLITLLSILGIVLYVFYLNHPILNATLQNPDALVPHYAASMLPHGLAGLVVASIFAGSMSTVSASLNSLATSSIVDIYRRLIRKGRPDSYYALASRWATLLWGLMATAGALYANRLGALALSFVKVQGLIGGVILGIFLLAILSSRTTSNGAIAGSIVGLAMVLYISLRTPVTVYWYSVVGCAGTVLTGWLWSCAFNLEYIKLRQDGREKKPTIE